METGNKSRHTLYNSCNNIHIVPESNDPVAITITTPPVLEFIAHSFLN